ncbi:MAG TPA: GH116 family glycosyl-hydrolase, partial [Spirochaetia bacterium]|nr:GH116 family glycosyl-hydrolase [Spirochaetia bacterium]
MNIPSAAWQRRLDLLPEQPGRPAFWALGSLIRLVPTYFRLRATLARDRKAGRESMLVSFDPRHAGPVQGVPLGGMGGGTVTRGWRGDFVRWQLQPGCYSYGAVPADQFSVAVRRQGRPVQARVLYPGRPAQSVLGSWDWGMDGACATYHALFPRAWTTYENPVPGVRLTCRQVSPVIPHDYKASSLPVGVFVWTVENTGAEPATISLMMTFQNGIGAQNDLDGGHVNRRFRLEAGGGATIGKEGPIVGVSLVHANRQNGLRAPGQREAPKARYRDPLTFAIAAQGMPGIRITSRPRFIASGDGSDVWEPFSRLAQLEENADDAPSPAGTAVGAALAAT